MEVREGVQTRWRRPNFGDHNSRRVLNRMNVADGYSLNEMIA